MASIHKNQYCPKKSAVVFFRFVRVTSFSQSSIFCDIISVTFSTNLLRTIVVRTFRLHYAESGPEQCIYINDRICRNRSLWYILFFPLTRLLLFFLFFFFFQIKTFHFVIQWDHATKIAASK